MACYRSPSMALDRKTLKEVQFENPCNYSNLKIFGCHTLSCQNLKSRKCIFVGYTKGMKEFWLWDLLACKIITCDMYIDDLNALKGGMKNESNKKKEIHET